MTETVQSAKAEAITTPYGFGVTLDAPIDEALDLVTAALKKEGFGILTTIDVKQTMKQKLDVDFEPYYILGACNPPLAYAGLTAVHDLGLLLPCNVIVHQHGDGTRVDVADPEAMLNIVGDSALTGIAREANDRLHRALEHLANPD